MNDAMEPSTQVELFAADRDAYLKATLEGIKGKVLLKGPVHEARATLFNYDDWLEAGDVAADFLHAELTTVAVHFSSHFDREFGSGWLDDLKSEWRAVVQLIVDKRDGRWKRHSYNDIWKSVLQHADTGKAAQLLIEIEMAIALDTACAERWFSLMAEMKNKKRNRMNDELLNKLMFICLHAPRSILALKEVVNDIRLIWKEGKDRYKKKWAEWEAVVDQMADDELHLNDQY